MANYAVTSRTTHEITLNVPGREVPVWLTLEYAAEITQVYWKPDEQRAVVVQYDRDDCAEHPLEDSDCYGEIVTCHRHDREGQRRMLAALALNECGDPDYDLVIAWEGWGAAVEDAWENRKIARAESGEDREADYDPDYDYEDLEETLQAELWPKLRDRGLIGDPDGVVLDCFQHGQVIWSVSGTGPQCRWDNAEGAGIWLPNACLRDHLSRWPVGSEERRAEAVKLAKEACQVYTAWCNGDVWWWRDSWFDLAAVPDEASVLEDLVLQPFQTDSCGGYYGWCDLTKTVQAELGLSAAEML